MVVGNEMEIFITLTKCNIRQWRGEGKSLLVITTFISIYYPHHICVQSIYEEWDLPINVHTYGI